MAGEWLHRLHLLFVDNYIPISLEQFEVPLGVRVKSTFGIARILKSDTYISLSMKNVNWGSVGTCLLSIFLRRRGEF